MKRVPIVALMILSTALFAGNASAMSHEGQGTGTVKIALSAFPKVDTKAGGEAVFTINPDGTSLHYVLRVEGVTNATMGHIHEASEGGAPGAVLVWIYPTTGAAPSLKEGSFSGILAEGDIDSGKIGGPMKGGTVKALFEKIEHRRAGVAVHTKGNPGGELWGVRKEGERPKKSM